MYRSKQALRALTLIELLVVLIVLVAVAGLAIPVVSNVTRQSHGATGASSLSRVDSAFRTREASAGRVGAPGFDSMIESSDAVVPYMMYPGTGMVVCDLSAPTAGTPIPDAATAQRVATALTNAGITSSRLMNDDATIGDATFNNTASDVAITATPPAGKVIALDPTFVTDLPLDTTNRLYVAFGLGNDALVQGQVVAESPTFLPAAGSPRERYSNFLVVYEIPLIGNNPVARYASVGMPMMGGVWGVNRHVQIFHESRDDS